MDRGLREGLRTSPADPRTRWRPGDGAWRSCSPAHGAGRLYLRLRLDETPRFRLLLGYLALGAVMGCFVLPSFLSELFPTRVRSSGLAIVLPQAERAADLGLDPTPLLAVVSELLRLYADALRLPNPTGL
jgi:hypothetical protein